MKEHINLDPGTFTWEPTGDLSRRGHFQLERAANGGWILYSGLPGVGFIPNPPIGAYSSTADMLAALADVLDEAPKPSGVSPGPPSHDIPMEVLVEYGG